MRISGVIASVIVLITLLFHFIYFKRNSSEPDIPKGYKFQITLFLIAPFLSMWVAKYYHFQSIGLSLYAQVAMYLYLFYFLLHEWHIDGVILERIIIGLGIAYGVIYLIQWSIYPITILNTRINVDRGTVRIFFPGAAYSLLAYWIYVRKALVESPKLKYLIIILVLFVVNTILQGSRAPLVFTTGLTGLYLLTGKQIKNRMVVIIIALIIAFCIFLIFMEMFIELYELSMKESGGVEDNPRLMANKFFLTDFMPAKIAYILGNGADHGASPFGQKIWYYKLYYGYFQSDIGLIGTYSKYGLALAIAYISFLIRCVFFKLPKKLDFLRFVFLGSLLSIFTGSGSYTNFDGVPYFAIIMYMIDYYKNQESKTQSATTVL